MRLCRFVLFRIEGWFSSAFGEDNPLYHLGALGFYFFYIMLVSGIYLFFYYEPTVAGSYDQLEYLTREQWYLGGVMRSLHRYAADGMVFVMALHLLRELVLGRFHGARWFSWFTGVPLIIMVYLSGIIGFWMVWDKLGQFIAVRTSEWLDWLPVFASPMARNFLLNTDVTDLFFRLLIVAHIGVPLFLLAGMLTHVKRVSRARVLPPRVLALGTLAALLLLSLARPTVSHARADLDTAVNILHLDWFYLFPYPWMEVDHMGGLWLVMAVVFVLLLFLPWIVRHRPAPVAMVNLDYCSGCGLCADDCPYEAIDMRQRSDAHPLFWQEAHVIVSNCVHCGICTGACPSSNPFRRITTRAFGRTGVLKSGIEMPQLGVDALRRSMEAALDSIRDANRILLLGCAHGADVRACDAGDVALLQLPCLGMLPPAFIEHAFRRGAAGVLLSGCRKGGCYYRLGERWLDLRLQGARRPFLRKRADRSRIGICRAAPPGQQALEEALDALRHALRKP